MNTRSKSAKHIIARVIVYAILIAVVISIAYPFIFMVLNSFKTKSEYYSNIFGLPRALNIQNYKIALERFDVLRLGFHSLIVTVCSLLINVTICSMAAYAFAKLKYRFYNKVLGTIIACMMIPGQVLMIPVYMIMSNLGLINNFASAILFNVAMAIPFGTYMLTTQCQNIPDEILDAAEIDGSTVPKTFVSVILPLMKPAVMTLVILNFLQFWNELLYSMLFLQDNRTRTLTVEIATSVGKYSSNMPLMITGLLLNCVPTILIFIFFQKYISKGLMVGAVK